MYLAKVSDIKTMTNLKEENMDKVIRCVLTFDTNLDTRRTMSISDPEPELESEAVVEAAGRIIAADLHDELVGAFRRLYRADIVSTSTNVLI